MRKIDDLIASLSFIAVDIETTGLRNDTDTIIEISGVKFKGASITDSFQSFIHINQPIPGHIKALTHITDDDLAGAPSLKIVLEEFLDFIGDAPLCFHNARFDKGFIDAALNRSLLPPLINEYYDTLEISQIFLPHIRSHSLGHLSKYFHLTNNAPHRAEDDAIVTGKLLLKLTEFICQHFDIGLLNLMQEISNQIQSFTLLPQYITTISKYLVRSVLQYEPAELPSEEFFPQTNFVSNIKENEKPINTLSADEVLSLFEAPGQIAQRFPDYEFRQGQIDMAAYVTKAYQENKFLLIEAGTGVGKSLAYLIPSIFYSKHANTRIIISTNTKNLQEQLFYKDIPTIQEVTDLSFAAALLKGRGNYLCLRKWNEVLSDIQGHLTGFEQHQLLMLLVWARYTHTGDIEENRSFRAEGNPLWYKIAADSNFCHGRKCSFYNECFVMQIRNKANRSNLVMVNHALMLADAVNENSVLGNYSNIIIDEAHNLPQAAATHFGFSFSLFDLTNLTRQLLTRKEYQYGIANNIKTAVIQSTLDDRKKNSYKALIDDITEPLQDIEEIGTKLFTAFNKIVIQKGNYGKLRFQNLSLFQDMISLIESLIVYIERLYHKLRQVCENWLLENPHSLPFYDENLSDLEGILNKAHEVWTKLQLIFLSPDFENYAFWLETRDHEFEEDAYPHCSLICAPIEVNQQLYDFFWSRLETAIFTSATLAIRGEYKFYKSLTGLDKLEEDRLMEFIASSPFDYEKQMQVIVPNFLPNPQDKYFFSQTIALIDEILSTHRRGTLVLFTAYKDLDAAFNTLTNSALEKGILLLAQGKTGTRTNILDIFRKEKNSVLLGTRSFWEGIDVQGEALEILIMYRLPFLVPTEPLVEAYMEKLQKQGKDSFLHYLLPITLLYFKQGFGRLIRNRTDKGVVVILDSRIFKKSYGKYFLNTIPVNPIKASSNLEITDRITRWFED
ncbi:MAG: helicase C-terminal domain-containing protein [Candidatus Cloacimonadia bacterium]